MKNNNYKLQYSIILFFCYYIGDYVFSNCPSLTDVTLTNGLKVLGSKMFNTDNALKTIIIPSTITTIYGNRY